MALRRATRSPWSVALLIAVGATACGSESGSAVTTPGDPDAEICWVAMGMDETWTSADGVRWTSQPSPRPDWGWSTIADLATDGSNVVALGADGYWSEDGRTWTLMNLVGPAPSSGFGPQLEAVGWSGQSWMILGDRFARTSPNGRTWTPAPAPDVSFPAIAGDGDTWAVVGQWAAARRQGSGGWEVRDVPSTDPEQPQMDAVIRDGERWLAVGTNRQGLEGLIQSSDDGLTWTTVATTTRQHFPSGIAAHGGTIVVVGADVLADIEGYAGEGLVWVSRDGGPFVEQATGVPQLRDVATDGTTWVAAGAGAILTSTDDGATWTRVQEVDDVLGGVVNRCGAASDVS